MGYNKSLFQGVPKKNVNKSRFNLSHEHKAQMLPGYLTPVLTMETLPQDEWNINTEFMFRFSPLYFPIMHKMTMRADYFFIPNRILWPGTGGVENVGWAKWIAEQSENTHPHFQANMAFSTAVFNNHVLAHMGLPLITPVVGSTEIIENLSALPLSAYLKIWDEYYRVPQLENERWFALSDGDNTAAFESAFGVAAAAAINCLSAKWEKDYFTSALPTPQIGDAIQIPLVNDADGDGLFYDNLPTTWKKLDDGSVPTTGNIQAQAPSGDTFSAIGEPIGLDIQETAATIRQLRLAEVLQSYYERIMKVGQRYRDFIEGLWGNDPEPNTVDVPVLLGSRFGRIQIADVMTQATNEFGETGDSMTGDYRGQANMYSSDNDEIRYFCREHGWIICILQVNPNTSYGQGIERFWRRTVQTDYALDMFAGIGDQEILKEEVLYNPLTAEEEKNFDTFGYIPRFSEYRYKNNLHINTLNFTSGKSQHLGRWWNPETITGAAYDNVIEINSDFISSAPSNNGGIRLTDVFRILPNGPQLTQYPAEGVIYAHLFHSIYINRALPMFSTPKL